MTDDEIIAVVQARKEGRKIQSRSSEEYYGHKAKKSNWSDCCSVTWDFYHVDYRVAPEPRKPREWTVCVDEQGRLWDYRHTHRDNCFTVREVIEPL